MGKIIDGKRHGIWEVFSCSKAFAILHFVNGKASGLMEIHNSFHTKHGSNIFEISEINFYLK